MERVFGDVVLVVVAEVVGRRKEGVHTHPESILDHVRNYPFEDRSTELEIRVGVHFDQPRSELIIHHEVQPEKLKVFVLSLQVETVPGRFDC